MILITGASGSVGSEVLKQAAAAGLPTRAAYQNARQGEGCPGRDRRRPHGLYAAGRGPCGTARGAKDLSCRPATGERRRPRGRRCPRGSARWRHARREAVVSHIDIRNIATVAVKVLSENDHEGKAYALTGPEALTNERLSTPRVVGSGMGSDNGMSDCGTRSSNAVPTGSRSACLYIWFRGE